MAEDPEIREIKVMTVLKERNKTGLMSSTENLPCFLKHSGDRANMVRNDLPLYRFQVKKMEWIILRGKSRDA